MPVTCPHCSYTFKPPRVLGKRAGIATQAILALLAKQERGYVIKASSVHIPNTTRRQINNAFVYLDARGLVERVHYGHYRIT